MKLTELKSIPLMQYDWHADNFDEQGYDDREESKRNALDECDMARYELPDGSHIWTAETNHNGGQCDCCNDSRLKQAVKVTTFKIE